MSKGKSKRTSSEKEKILQRMKENFPHSSRQELEKLLNEMDSEDKKRASVQDQYEKDLAAWFEQQDKAMDAALIVNPELRSLFEEVKKKEKTANCSELKGMLDKIRMLRDNKDWQNELEWIAINRIFVQLLDVFEKRCHEMWKVYAGKLRHKYAKEMEEAWHWRKIEPLKEELSREELEERRSKLKKLMKHLAKTKQE